MQPVLSTNTLTIPNSITSSSSPSSSSTGDSDSRQQCPACGQPTVGVEYAIGSIVCHNCGLVLSETVFERVDSGLSLSFHTQGLVAVDRIGRPRFVRPQARSIGHTAFSRSDMRRVYRAKRIRQVHEYLTAACSPNNLHSTDLRRAYYLWKQCMGTLRLQFWDPAARAALACLYIASKESRRGLSLIEIALRAEISPFKLGATYKLVKATLLENHHINPDNPCFSIEEDPWVMLERILHIGSQHSVQQGAMDRLPDQIRDAFGLHLGQEQRSLCLRHLFSTSQKCMTIAVDSGLATGRQPPALVAACLVVAVEIQLLLAKPCEELLEFAAITFSCSLKNLRTRYRELQQCMLVWARRLPFVKDAGNIKGPKLIYHLEDVVKYFGHLNKQNKQLWAVLDASESAPSDGEDDVGKNEAGLTEGDDAFTWESENDDDRNTDWDKVNQEETSSTARFTRIDPPSYIANRAREKQNLDVVDAAKLANKNPQSLLPLSDDNRMHQRIEWTRRLLQLGTRTEHELAEATDNALDYWMRSDFAKLSSTPRSQQQLNSVHLTAEDLNEEEARRYLRAPSEIDAIQRVRTEEYLWTEAMSRRATAKITKAADAKMKRSPSVQDSSSPKRVRSSKLNLDALSDDESHEQKQDEGRTAGGTGGKRRSNMRDELWNDWSEEVPSSEWSDKHNRPKEEDEQEAEEEEGANDSSLDDQDVFDGIQSDNDYDWYD
ncbi:hypothetical protein BGZ98_003605 [Dissophora globulifera]|nr:hypothetical protein BGZ98_003605 [Dissophora globulifera]